MSHSDSRGVGNRIDSYFIELAKRDMRGGGSARFQSAGAIRFTPVGVTR